jgi:hypothetical protein
LRSFSLIFDRKGFAQLPMKGWRDEVSMEQNQGGAQFKALSTCAFRANSI